MASSLTSKIPDAGASPIVVRVKLLKPDSSGHMERIFLHFSDAPSPVGLFMTGSSFQALATSLAQLPDGPSTVIGLFDVRYLR